MIRAQKFIASCGLALLGAAAMLVVASAAGAEQAWIARDLELPVRSGAGIQFRAIASLNHGDGVKILQRAEKWTHVELEDGTQGWISAGYLKSEAPPTVRLGQLEAEVVELRGELETVTAERESLSNSNSELASNDQGQESRISELTQENMRLTAGQRWPEWITGGAMVVVGMLLGALWSRSSGRRNTPRIRL